MTRILHKRVRLRPGDKDGQSLIIVALSLVLLLAFLGFVVDAAHAFVDYRHLQNSADAASLAGAQELNGAAACAAAAPDPIQGCATLYVEQNGYPWPADQWLQPCGSIGPQPPTRDPTSDLQGCYESPYGDPGLGQVLVMLRDCTSTFFGGLVGVHQICESVRSVARATPLEAAQTIPGETIPGTTIPGQTIPGQTTPGQTIPGQTTPGQTIPGQTTPGQTIPGTTVPGTTVYTTQTVTTGTAGSVDQALFAYANDGKNACSTSTGIVVSGNGNGFITGAVSNGDLTNTGNTSIGAGEYLNTSGPPAAHCTSNLSSNVAANSQPQPWPLTFSQSAICGTTATTPSKTTDPPPGYYNTAITLDGSNADGVYCSTVSIAFTTNNWSTNVTVVAPLITNNGNHHTWCPYYGSTGPNYCDQSNGSNLVMWETGPDSGGGNDLSFTDQNSSVNGVIWDEGGNLTYDSNSGSFGFYEAQNVTVDGNHYEMTGTGPPIGGAASATTIITPVATVQGTTNGGSTGPNQTIPGQTTPGQTTPGQTTPGQTTPGVTCCGATNPGTTNQGTTQTVTTATTIGLRQ